MSWTALILAGALLAQPPYPPSALQESSTAPLYGAERSDGANRVGGNGPTPASGPSGSDRGLGLPPMPSTVGPSYGSEIPPAGQSGLPAPPAPASGAPPDPNSPFSALPLPFQRMIDLDKHQQEQQAEAARAEAAKAETTPWTAGTAINGPSPTLQQPPVQSPAVPRLTAKEMLEQAMTLPPSTAVTGRPVTLLDVLGQITNRDKRVEITHAYWQLARKLGEYRFCWEESQRIQSIGVGTIDSNLLASAQQAADRELTAAELALLEAQYALAEVAGLDSSGQLPLPGDRPHIGTYTTHFEQIAADLTLPAQTRLLHRTLPLQYQVIDVRVEAVRAAQDALVEVGRSYGASQVDAADLLAALREITTQRRAWINSVAQYNHSIADYALSIAGPETTGRRLVAILIKLSQAEPPSTQDKRADMTGSQVKVPGVPTLAPPRSQVAEAQVFQAVPPMPVAPIERADLAVNPASAETPIGEDGGGVADPAVTPAFAEFPAVDTVASDGADVPEPGVVASEEAFSRSVVQQDVPAEAEEGMATESALPEDAEPSEAVAEVDVSGTPLGEEAAEDMAGQMATPNDAGPSEALAESAASDDMSAAPEEESARPRDPVVQTYPMVAVEELDAGPKTRIAYRPAGVLGRYGDLTNLSAGVQAKRLTALFCGGAEVIDPEAEVVELEACLAGVAGDRRRVVIEAYWEASLRVAEYEVYRTHVELLDDLTTSVTLGQAGTADARSRLIVARLDAEANLLDAKARLLAAEYELTSRCGRPLDEPWLVPTTLPHAGDYRLHLESQPSQVVESWPLKRLAAIIPALNRSLKDRAGSVVDADSRRIETVSAYQARTLRFDRVLSAVEQQTEDCLEFLNVVAAYNQSIADYVTTVVSETLPETQLVATLVVR